LELRCRRRIRSERKLCEEVRLHLAYRFCQLDLNDAVPHHSTYSENRLNRFRESDIVSHIFERVVIAAMVMGLVKGPPPARRGRA
jgi:transposase